MTGMSAGGIDGSPADLSEQVWTCFYFSPFSGEGGEGFCVFLHANISIYDRISNSFLCVSDEQMLDDAETSRDVVQKRLS